MKYKDKSKCHVRHNYITKHYSAIIGEDKNNYEYKGLSHENYRNKKVKLNFNPNKNDKRIAYIDKKSRTGKKRNFGRRKSWKFDKSDYDKL